MFIRLHISLNSWLQTTETDSHEPKRKLLEEYWIAPRTRKEAGTRLRREGRDGGTAGLLLRTLWKGATSVPGTVTLR